jgi:hypothetical protein
MEGMLGLGAQSVLDLQVVCSLWFLLPSQPGSPLGLFAVPSLQEASYLD